jgi:hypothetical protein
VSNQVRQALQSALPVGDALCRVESQHFRFYFSECVADDGLGERYQLVSPSSDLLYGHSALSGVLPMLTQGISVESMSGFSWIIPCIFTFLALISMVLHWSLT